MILFHDNPHTLKYQIDKEQEKIKKNAFKSSQAPSDALIPTDFPIIHRFSLDDSTAAYVLSVELQTPIDLIIIRSPVSLSILESGTCIVSFVALASVLD
jgi:hypothetical protein